MARGSSVYAVMKETIPVMGFTVQHELLSWLSIQTPEFLEQVCIYKFPDGVKVYHNGKGPQQLNISDLLQVAKGK